MAETDSDAATSMTTSDAIGGENDINSQNSSKMSCSTAMSPSSSSFFGAQLTNFDGQGQNLPQPLVPKSPVSAQRAHFRTEQVLAFEGRRDPREVWICDRAPSSPLPGALPDSSNSAAAAVSNPPLSSADSAPQAIPSRTRDRSSSSTSGSQPPLDYSPDSSATASPVTPLCHLGQRPPLVHGESVPDHVAGDKLYQKACSRPVSRKTSVSQRDALQLTLGPERHTDDDD